MYPFHDLMTALRADPTRSWTAQQVLSYAATVPQAGPPDPLSMSDYLGSNKVSWETRRSPTVGPVAPRST